MTDHDDFLRTILAEPNNDAPRLVFCDWLDERGEQSRANWWRSYGKRKPLKIHQDTVTVAACLGLGGCSFAPATWDKKFVRDVCNYPHPPAVLTAKQFVWVWVLAKKYRRQICNLSVQIRIRELFPATPPLPLPAQSENLFSAVRSF